MLNLSQVKASEAHGLRKRARGVGGGGGGCTPMDWKPDEGRPGQHVAMGRGL